mmetsp:Transcript_47277/g.135496  ORF Transcript_47277/g.135496 Transcript_47277/m.135496 type:complete len:224 (+) Transcript_47277:943-1614(+)
MPRRRAQRYLAVLQERVRSGVLGHLRRCRRLQGRSHTGSSGEAGGAPAAGAQGGPRGPHVPRGHPLLRGASRLPRPRGGRARRTRRGARRDSAHYRRLGGGQFHQWPLAAGRQGRLRRHRHLTLRGLDLGLGHRTGMVQRRGGHELGVGLSADGKAWQGHEGGCSGPRQDDHADRRQAPEASLRLVERRPNRQSHQIRQGPGQYSRACVVLPIGSRWAATPCE